MPSLKNAENNRSLAVRVEATSQLAADRAVLLKRQRDELDRLKKHDREIADMASEKDRVLAKLTLKKQQRSQKNDEWLWMVKQFGCGVTITDLKELMASQIRRRFEAE